MTILDEGRQLRGEVSKLRHDKRRRYPPALRDRILCWVDRAVGEGMQETACGKMLGIKTWRFKMWRDAALMARPTIEPPPPEVELRLVPATRPEAPALVQLEVPPIGPSVGLVLVAPSGHRVEGLQLDHVVVLLRGLA